jgi:phosphoglycolate phosphatase-like HAD superfamily hydrolase
MEKLIFTREDQEDRDTFRIILEIMKMQGAIGESQSTDYEDALWYIANLEIHNKKNLPEGDVTQHFDNIIFDFDGVIYDSANVIYKAALIMIQYYKAHHIEIPKSHKDVASSFSSPAIEYFKRFGIDFISPEEAKEFREYYLKVVKPKIEEGAMPDLYPEVNEVLGKIRLAKSRNPNLKVMILSAGRADEVIPNLERLGIKDFFDDIKVDQADKKEGIKGIVGESDPSRTIVIGDLPSDIKDAQAIAGVKTIAVARGTREKERLGYYLPDYLVTNLKELFNLKKYLANK